MQQITATRPVAAEADNLPVHLSSLPILVHGAGGQGKTEVALAVLHHPSVVARYGKSRFLIDCSITQLADAIWRQLHDLLRLLSPTKPKEAVVTMLGTLRDRSILLVLDNIETTFDTNNSDAIQLLNQLKSPSIVVLVTYRGAGDFLGTFIEFQATLLEGLAIEDAVNLYWSLKSGKVDPMQSDDVRGLLNLVDRMPLAIRVISALSDPPRKLVERWNALDPNIVTGPRSGGDHTTSVSKSVELSLQSDDFRASPISLRLLQLLSCLPAGLSDTDDALSSIGVHSSTAASLREKQEQLHQTCGARDLLIQRALANKRDGRLVILSPIRLHMQQTEFDRSQLNAHFIDLVKDKDIHYMPSAEAAQLYDEVPNLCGSIRSIVELMPETASSDDFEYLRTQLSSVRCAMKALNFYSDSARIDEIGLTFFTSVNYILGQAQCMQSLGDVAYMQGDFSRAQQLLKDTITLFEQANNQVGQAQCTRLLGDIAYKQYDYESAQHLLESAKMLFEQASHPYGQAQCVQSLAEIAHMQDDYEGAQTLYGSALILYRQSNDGLGQAQVIRSLGNIAYLQDDYQKAQLLLESATTVFERANDRLGRAQCLQSLANVAHMLGDYEKARPLLETAMEVFEAINDRSGQALCTRSLGDIAYMQDDLSKAQLLLERAITLFKQASNLVGQAQCTLSLGDIALSQHNYSRARLLLESALRHFEQSNHRLGQAQCVKSLGDTAYMQTDYKKAQALYESAMTLSEHASDRLGQARCMRSMGDIARLQGDYAKARPLLESAIVLFEQASNRLGQTQTLQALAILAIAEKQWLLAMDLTNKARMMAHAIGNPLEISNCAKLRYFVAIQLDQPVQPKELLLEVEAAYARAGASGTGVARELSDLLASMTRNSEQPDQASETHSHDFVEAERDSNSTNNRGGVWRRCFCR